MKIEKLWERYRVNHLPHVRDAARAEIAWAHLSKTFSRLTPEQVTPEKVEKYCAGRDVSNATLNRELTVLSAVLGYGRKTGMTMVSPFIQKRSGTVKKISVLCEEDVARLLKVCAGNHALSLFVKIALLTGQRKTAIVQLRWSQVDWGSLIVDFRDQAAANQSRMKGRGIVPMTGDFLGLLGYEFSRRTQSEYVIKEWEGDVTKLTRPFKKACLAAGIAEASPHTLRHTVASSLVRQGVPILPVSKLLGHSSSKVTESTYITLSPDFLTEAVGKLSLTKN